MKHHSARMRSLILSFVSGLGLFALSAQTCGAVVPISPWYDCTQYYAECEEYCAEKGGVAIAACDPQTGNKTWPPKCHWDSGVGLVLNPPTFQGAPN